MELTEQHIEYISTNLEFYGLKDQDLKEDVLDHMCTAIEQSDLCDFEQAYQAAIQNFGGYFTISQIEQEIKIQVHFKAAKNRNKLSFVIELLTAMLISTGFLFKIMHWPYSSWLLSLGFVFLITITLPLYFYSKYKEKSVKYQS